MKRRTAIRWLFSFLAVLPFRRARLYAQARSFTESDVSTLRDTGAVVLPSALGRDGTDAVVDAFLRWLENYRPGAEISPGYGKPTPRQTPPLDLSSYGAQLRALRDVVAGAGAGALPEAKRRVAELMEEAGVQRLPSRPNGQHVVSDLLSFYVRSSEARDLCYEAKIGRYTCPGLSGMGEKPAPLNEA